MVKESADKVTALAKARDIYQQAREEDIALIAVQPDPTKWNIAQLKMMLKPLKKKEDGPMPTLKAKMLQAYLLWKDRVAPVFDEVAETGTSVEEADVAAEDDDQELNAEEEAVSAMLALLESGTV